MGTNDDAFEADNRARIARMGQDVALADQSRAWFDAVTRHGYSYHFHASMLRLLGRGHVIGVDIDIRPENRAAIESHPLAKDITLIQGSSVDPDIVARVAGIARNYSKVMVVLDSMHTHDHVLAELHAYAPFVSKDAYLCVLDTVVEFMADDHFPDRPWSRGNNPYTAVHAFMGTTDAFEIDTQIATKLLVTVAPDGYLRRTA
jgi:cephalosporin hydroxylase